MYFFYSLRSANLRNWRQIHCQNKQVPNLVLEDRSLSQTQVTEEKSIGDYQNTK